MPRATRKTAVARLPKPPAPSPKLPEQSHGGVLFAAIVFIVLSMMLITQSNALQSAVKRLSQPTGTPTDNEQLQLAQCQAQVQDLQQQMATAPTSTPTNVQTSFGSLTQLESYMTAKDADQRLLGFLLWQNASNSFAPFNATIMVHRPSPSGKRTAVVYGHTTGTNPGAVGFFIRENGLIVDNGVMLWSGDSILRLQNVKWTDEHTIEYDETMYDPTAKTTQRSHKTYQTK